MSPAIIFRLNILKGTAKAPAVNLLRLNTLTELLILKHFLIPKIYDDNIYNIWWVLLSDCSLIALFPAVVQYCQVDSIGENRSFM